MRILLINNFDYIRGGSDRVFVETTKLLVEKGHEVAIFTAVDRFTEAAIFPNEIRKYGTKDIMSNDDIGNLKKSLLFIKNHKAQNDLIECLKDFQPDITHLHIFQSRLSSFIVKTLKSFDIPMVMTVHEYKMLCPVYSHLTKNGEICESCSPMNYLPCVRKRCVDGNLMKSILMATESYSRDLFTSYVKEVDKFIMVSQFILHKHHEKLREYQHKFIQIYNFVDEAKFKGEYYYGDCILYFGRLSKEKGLFTLLKASKALPHIPFKIAGTGILYESLKNYIRDNKLKNVELVGFQSGEDLVNLVNSARFTIVPSEWYETLGMNIIESFFLKKPVLGAAIGGISELVIENQTGYLFESKNEIDLISVLSKAWEIRPDEHEVLSHNAYQYALEEFNKEKHYDSLLEVYMQLKK